MLAGGLERQEESQPRVRGTSTRRSMDFAAQGWLTVESSGVKWLSRRWARGVRRAARVNFAALDQTRVPLGYVDCAPPSARTDVGLDLRLFFCSPRLLSTSSEGVRAATSSSLFVRVLSASLLGN